jgi:hypothetical protein
MTGLAAAPLVGAAGCASFKTGPSDGGGGGDAGFGVDAEGGAPADADGDAGPNPTTFSIVQQIPDGGALGAIWGSGANDIHAVGDNGMIYDFDGNTWTALGGAETGAWLSGVWGSGPNDVYAVGTLAADARGIVLHYDGSGWVQQASTATSLLSVWGVGGRVWAVGPGGHVYEQVSSGTWTDNGGHFAPNPNVDGGADAPALSSISGNAPNLVVVAGGLDSMYWFDGTYWNYSYDPVDRTRSYHAVWGAPSSTLDVFIGANYYGIWWWAADLDGGTQTYYLLNEERDSKDKANDSFWGIWGPSSDRVVFVGDGGRVMWFNGGPDNPKIVPCPVQTSLYGVWGTSLDDVWIVGDDATILHGSIPQ